MHATLKDCEEAYTRLEYDIKELKKLICDAHNADIPTNHKLALAQGLCLMTQVESRSKSAHSFCRECQGK